MTTNTVGFANTECRKYCKTCGAVVGLICSRCGALNENENTRCAGCGIELTQSVDLEPHSPVGQSVISQGGSGQYTVRDVEELLALRESLFRDADLTEALHQDDIDSLFKGENP